MYYPEDLPGPTKANHAVGQRLSATDLPGVEQYSRRQTDYSGTVDLEFFFTAEQAERFFAWWRDDTIEGGSWFNSYWPNIRPGLMTCKFKEPPALRHVYDGAHRVTVTAQVRGATLPVRRLLRDAYRSEVATPNEYAGYVRWLALMEGSADLEIFRDEMNQGPLWPSTTKPTASSDAPFGASSVQFAQARRLDLFVPAYTPFSHYTTPFAYDGWVKITNFAGTISGYHTLISDDTHSGGSTWNVIFAVSAAGALYAVVRSNASVVSANGLIAENVWNHVSIAYAGPGNPLRIRLNGQVVATGASNLVAYGANNPTRLSFGCQNSNFVGSFERPLLGRMKAWRAHIGVCPWPGADDAPVPRQLADYHGVRTVLDMTPAGDVLVDSSGYAAKTCTLENTAVVEAETDPLTGGHRLSLPGPDAHATVAAHSDFSLGGADYCLEMRVFCLSYPATTRWAYDSRTTSPQMAPSFELWTSTGAMYAAVNTYFLNPTDYPFPLNQWVSLILMRVRGVYIYLQDGKMLGAMYMPGHQPALSTQRVGASYLEGANTFWHGKVRRARLTRSAARYYRSQLPTDAFPVGQASDPRWSNTVFQMDMEGANNGSIFRDQSRCKHSVTSVNSAWTVNSHSRFGYTSLSVPTTGYLQVSYSDWLNLQGKVFTVEGHLLTLVATVNTYYLFNFGGTGPAGQSWAIRFDNTARKLQVYDNASSSVVLETPANSLKPATFWTHWAVVYDGVGNLQLVIDGVVLASATYVVPATHASGPTIGRTGVAPAFNGRHGNIRIRLEAMYPVDIEIPPWQDFSYLN